MMEALGLPPPAVVAVSMAMGSEDLARAGFTVKGVDSRQTDGLSILGSPASDRCSSLSSQKDEAGAAGASESASWNKTGSSEFCPQISELPTLQHEDVCERLFAKGTDCSLSLVPGPDVKKLPQKAGKVSRNSSSSSNKRVRVTKMKDSANGLIDNKFNKLEESTTGCTFPEKAEVTKEKNNVCGKRGDKRNYKVPKSKHDSFPLKPGSMCFNSAADVCRNFGVTVPKSDVHDIMKHEDELPLDALLDGSYTCPTLGKFKGRKPPNLDENVLQSVRKAISILRLSKPAQSGNFLETDSASSHKLSTCLLSSDPSMATSNDSEERDPSHADPATQNKPLKIEDSFSQPYPANGTDSPLFQPKVVLDRLALPPPMHLDSLLLETGKYASSSRNIGDPGLVSNSAAYHGSLPPFPWSHFLGGQSKTSSDAGKSSACRSSCQARWVRIGKMAEAVGGAAHSFENLGSLTFDHNLVPSAGKKSVPSQIQGTRCVSVSSLNCEHDPSSPATCSAIHSPRTLGAAQTLVDIAARSSELKKSPQRVLKLHNRKSIESPTKPESVRGRNAKKPGLSTSEKRQGLGFANTFIKGPMGWSTPRSSRSSPIRFSNESGVKRKRFNGIVRPSCTVSPSSRALDKVCNGQSKVKRLIPMDWSSGRGKLH